MKRRKKMKNTTPAQTETRTTFEKAQPTTDATATRALTVSAAPARKILKRSETEMETEDNYETLTGRFATTLASIAILCGALFLFAATVNAKTFVVTTTVDNGNDANPTAGSLRKAIVDANAAPGADIINFNIPGAGVHTFLPPQLHRLPTITDQVKIDGYSQPGATPNTELVASNALLLIELNGSSSGLSAIGLTIAAPNCEITGLIINNFEGNGIYFNGIPNSVGTTLTGCFIGTNAAGNLAAPNGIGIFIGHSQDIKVGDCSYAGLNLISGNANSGVVFSGTSVNDLVCGNLIGTDKSGTGAIPNRTGVVLSSVVGPNSVGGTVEVRNNVISGNKSAGVALNKSQHVLITTNHIGTSAQGSVKAGNANGIELISSDDNQIGIDNGSRNIIAGNTLNGILIRGTSSNNHVLFNFIGSDGIGNPMGNGLSGINLIDDAFDNIIGSTSGGWGNLIVSNSVGISSSAGVGNAIYGNSIHANTKLGIDLIGTVGPELVNDPFDADKGPNNLQNYPLIASAFNSGGQTMIIGELGSESNKTYRIEFFADVQCSPSGFGQGRSYLGHRMVTINNFDAQFTTSFPLVSAGQWIAATATDPDGNTSEFSPCRQVAAGPPGTLVFSSPTYSVNENIGTATVTILRTGGSTGAVSVEYMTSGGNGTATANADYIPVSGALNWNDGDASSRTFTIPVVDDVLDEPDETVNLGILNPTGGAIVGNPVALLTIVDNDASPALTISAASLAEGNSGTTNFDFNVTLSAASGRLITVDYVTADGTALVGNDYQQATGTLAFNPGETSKPITVLVNGDSTQEPDETFAVNLSNPINATLSKGQGTGTIVNDDAPAVPSFGFSQPNYSVAEGLSAMTLTVIRTGDSSGAASVDYATSDGSATQKGDFEFAAGTLRFASGEVSRTITVLLNQDIYGEGPESFNLVLSNPAGAALGSQSLVQVSINDDYLLQKESFASTPKYAEFMRDVQEVSRGVIVNAPGWEQKLKDNQQQFAEKWATRPEFKALYDGLSNDAYVTALYKNAGLVAPQAKKDTLVAGLNTASMNRAAVLLDIAADANFRQQEQNAAFVMMEYFGYLRRDPNAAPDSDLSGYSFWLNKLNQFGGSYVDAEMIKAFITSIEYRQRFAQ
jgi:hypothetical protein